MYVYYIIYMYQYISLLFVGRYRSSINDTSCTPRVNPRVVPIHIPHMYRYMYVCGPGLRYTLYNMCIYIYIYIYIYSKSQFDGPKNAGQK